MVEITRKELEEKSIDFDVVSTIDCKFDDGRLTCRAFTRKDEEEMIIALGELGGISGDIESVLEGIGGHIWIKTDFSPKRMWISKERPELGDVLYII